MHCLELPVSAAVRDALVRVRELLREPSAYRRPGELGPGVTMNGAVLSLAHRDAVRVVNALLPLMHVDMMRWELDHARTHADILALLDRAIAKESDK